MRYRPMVAIAAAAAIAAAMPAQAAVKTLDGKKTKAISFSLKTSPQSNDVNAVSDQVPTSTPVSRPANINDCPKTRCLRYTFKYAPAQGVKAGPFSVRIAWTIPGQDYDLYVVTGGGDVGHCGASAGSSETVVIDIPQRNKTYTVIVDQFRAAPDTIKGSITFPAKNAIGSTAPGDPDGSGIPVNCGLS